MTHSQQQKKLVNSGDLGARTLRSYRRVLERIKAKASGDTKKTRAEDFNVGIDIAYDSYITAKRNRGEWK